MKTLGPVALIFVALLAPPAFAQFVQQGAKLVGTGAVGPARQGVAVAVSGDGNTAIVGGENDNAGVGAAWIWTRSGSVWTQQGEKLVASDARMGGYRAIGQGRAVAISADGNTAIVGGPYDDDLVGAAWIWTRSEGVWRQQGPKLVASDVALSYPSSSLDGPLTANVYQGCAVALSADGNTAIVGASGDNYGAGAAWVWTRSGGIWTQQGPKLVGSGAVMENIGLQPVEQGWSVAISGDGNTAVVGGIGDGERVGALWVWTRSGGVWTQQGAKLTASDATERAFLGWSVALSADGSTLMAGGPFDAVSSGAAWIWTRSGGVWTQQGLKLFGSGASRYPSQGWSVALSGDGNTAITGGPFDGGDDTGSVWVWTRSGGKWTQQGNKLFGSGAGARPQLGTSVSLSTDGKTAIVGGLSNFDLPPSSGGAWIFVSGNEPAAPPRQRGIRH